MLPKGKIEIITQEILRQTNSCLRLSEIRQICLDDKFETSLKLAKQVTRVNHRHRGWSCQINPPMSCKSTSITVRPDPFFNRTCLKSSSPLSYVKRSVSQCRNKCTFHSLYTCICMYLKGYYEPFCIQIIERIQRKRNLILRENGK